MFDRLNLLIGQEDLDKIKLKKVCVIGLGGVGGYALEILIRSGIENITIVDFDTIDISNLNRQIITNQENVDSKKVLEAKKRMMLINPNANIECLDIKLDQDNLEDLLKEKFDYIIDACDTLVVKFLLMKYRSVYNYKLISSMGTAKKLDPTKLEITTLDKTSYDPLAKKLRNLIKTNHVKGKFYVVSSTEIAKDTGKVLGSFAAVPAVSGIYLASFVINDIIKNK